MCPRKAAVMHVAISRRRAKRLAAGSIQYESDIDLWYLTLYSVVDGVVVPFGTSPHDTFDQALDDGNGTLKVRREDWVEIDESDVEEHILNQTRNSWQPTQRKHFQ